MSDKKPRNITKVIEAIKKETTDKVLHSKLDQVSFDAGFRAPEVMWYSWCDLVDALNKYGPLLSTPEGKKIGAIMHDEIDVGARE